MAGDLLLWYALLLMPLLVLAVGLLVFFLAMRPDQNKRVLAAERQTSLVREMIWTEGTRQLRQSWASDAATFPRHAAKRVFSQPAGRQSE
jgi:hypothetical protein